MKEQKENGLLSSFDVKTALSNISLTGQNIVLIVLNVILLF